MPQKRMLSRRIPAFLIGLLIMALGVALSIKGDLGTSAIASTPYVLSLATPLTIGGITILMHCVFILVQILLLRERYRLFNLFQLVIAVVFGSFTDLMLFAVTHFLPAPANYFWQWIYCLAGMATLALGVFLLVKARILQLAGEGLVSAVSEVTGKEFATIKIFFDCTLAGLAILLSLFFLGSIEGVREGTVAAALFVGMIVRLYDRALPGIDHFLGFVPTRPIPEKIVEAAIPGSMVITVTREYGSGGVNIAKELGKLLGFRVYDDEVLTGMLARESGLELKFVKENEDRLMNGFLFNLYAQNCEYLGAHKLREDLLFEAKCRVIQKLLQAGENCVIVGHLASYILGKSDNTFHVFAHANSDYRVDQIMEEFGVDEAHARAIKIKTDTERQEYCMRHTGKTWGMASGFDLALDTSRYGIERSARVIRDALKERKNSPITAG